jgi:hypothetical protein
MPIANNLSEVLETTEPERLVTGFILRKGRWGTRTATGISSIFAAISYCALRPARSRSSSGPQSASGSRSRAMCRPKFRNGSTAEISQLPRSAWFTAASRRSAGSINPFPSDISRGQKDKTSAAVELLMSEVD